MSSTNYACSLAPTLPIQDSDVASRAFKLAECSSLAKPTVPTFGDDFLSAVLVQCPSPIWLLMQQSLTGQDSTTPLTWRPTWNGSICTTVMHDDKGALWLPRYPPTCPRVKGVDTRHMCNGEFCLIGGTFLTQRGENTAIKFKRHKGKKYIKWE